MTTTPPDLAGIDLPRLTRYLDDRLPGGLDGPLHARLVAGGRSNPTYQLGDSSDRSWILRRPPLGEVLQSAHDMMRESRVVHGLGGSGVPVATVVASCADTDVIGAPFYVMDRIDGRTLRTAEDTARLTPADRRAFAEAFVDTLVALHATDPAEVGLADFGRPVGYLDRQLARWLRQWDAIRTRDSPELVELHHRLAGSVPPLLRPGFVHGDYKLDNVMLDHDDAGRILALLDWEMATLGDTLADVGQMVSFWDEPGHLHNPITAGATALEGFPSGDEIVAAYAERAEVAVDDLDWYVVFADVKLAVILEQIHARYLAGSTVGDGFDDIGAMVVPILERAMTRAEASSVPGLRGGTR